jgi:hypothetical protein
MPQENTEVNFREVLDEWLATTIYFQLRGCVDQETACDLMFFGRRNAMLEQFERIMLTSRVGAAS